MSALTDKFNRLGMENAPGQEGTREGQVMDLAGFHGKFIDFGHGDVGAHEPLPDAFRYFQEGLKENSDQAFTPYRGRADIAAHVAENLSAFTGAAIDPKKNIILTPGTQGALFLAMGANIMPGDKVAIVQPDYFDNRKMVEFLQGEAVPVVLNYQDTKVGSGIDLEILEKAFADGVKVFLFSNPNNPTGCVYSYDEIIRIAALAKEYHVTLIVDQLYSRQIYPGAAYTHLCAQKEIPDNLITIIGPSKTESASGYRLGAGFGTPEIIQRMEQLQGIVSLRCAGYNQAVFRAWFREPDGWLAARLKEHQRIRDDLLALTEEFDGVSARPTDGGSYIFFELPELKVSIEEFTRICEKNADVIVTPGTEFGPQFTHHFRINFSQDHDVCIDAVRRVFRIMEVLKKR